MTAPVFVDTNVLVYRHDSADPVKQARAEDWISFLAQQRLARISFQVIQELYATLTRKLDPGFSAGESRDIARDLAVWEPEAIRFDTLERAWIAQQRHDLSWWDALILAAAQALGCGTLLSEDFTHGRSYGEVRVVNPFEQAHLRPAAVLKDLK